MKWSKAKSIKFITLLMCLPLLAGCNLFSSSSTEEVGSIYMEKSLSIESYINIGSQDLEDMLDYQNSGDKFDFVLFVYATDCSACTLAKSQIETLVKEKGYKIYGINKVSYDILANDDSFDLPSVSGTPQILFFSHEEVVRTIEGVYADYDSFKTEFEQSNKYPNINSYDVNDYSSSFATEDGKEYPYNEYVDSTTDTLDQLISASEEVTVLFTWKVCGDCSNLYDSFYLDYMNEDSSKNFYCFDVNYFRLTKPSSEPEDQTSEDYANWEKWVNFSSKYGFGSYRDGKVPSFVKFLNGEFSKMVVYANEGSAEQNDDGTYSYPNAYNESVKAIQAENENDLKVKANIEEISLVKELQ